MGFQIGKEERDATGKTIPVAQKTIHAWKETVIVTAMTNALVPWFVATTTVLGMDLMALMIAVQNQERQVLHLRTVVSECSPCTYSWKKVGTWKPVSRLFVRQNLEKHSKVRFVWKKWMQGLFWSRIVF